MNGRQSLIFRAAQAGRNGKTFSFSQGSITDALFVFLDGSPEEESQAALEAHFMARPWVCFTGAWEKYIQSHFQNVQLFTRAMMKPRRSFSFPRLQSLPKEYRLELMDETAFNRHPFGHGENYPSYRQFAAEAAGAVVWRENECMVKGFTVHWDAQNEVSKHLAQKFAFEVEEEYSVYYKAK